MITIRDGAVWAPRCHQCQGIISPRNAIALDVEGPRRPIPGTIGDILTFEGEEPRAFHYSCLVTVTAGFDDAASQETHDLMEEITKRENKRRARKDMTDVRRALIEHIATMPEPVVEQRDSNAYDPSLDEDDEDES
jgi:hypothetical protein